MAESTLADINAGPQEAKAKEAVVEKARTPSLQAWEVSTDRRTSDMGVSLLEIRVNRLEEENYFLRQRVEDLNEALTFQQKQIDRLEKALARAERDLDKLKGLVGPGGELPANEPPPHYNQVF